MASREQVIRPHGLQAGRINDVDYYYVDTCLVHITTF